MRRTIFALAAGILAVAACTTTGDGPPAGSATASQPPASAAAQPAPSQLAGSPIRVLDFTLEPLSVSVAGPDVTLAVRNDGPTIHNVTIRNGADEVVVGTADLREGEAETISANLAPGEYVMFCTLPGHESLGIRGTLTVVAR